MIRNDLIADIETVIVSLEATKGYSEFDIVDCMAHVIQKRIKIKQQDLFGNTKKRVIPKIDIPDKAIELANLFATLFTQNRKPTKPINIAAGARLLMRLNESVGSWDQIEWAIRYSQDKDNIKDKYMPVVWSMESLLKKYEQLVAHKKRRENDAKNMAFNKSLSDYQKPVRTVMYWDYKSFKYLPYSESHSKCPFEPNCDLEQFNLMTKEQRRAFFGVKTKEEMEEDLKKSKEILKKIKDNL